MAGAPFWVLDSIQVLSSPRTFRWLAAVLALLLLMSGTLLAVHHHKETRDCSLCILSHSPAAIANPAIAHSPEPSALPEPAADPVARTFELIRDHVIRPPPVVA